MSQGSFKGTRFFLILGICLLTFLLVLKGITDLTPIGVLFPNLMDPFDFGHFLISDVLIVTPLITIDLFLMISAVMWCLFYVLMFFVMLFTAIGILKAGKTFDKATGKVAGIISIVATLIAGINSFLLIIILPLFFTSLILKIELLFWISLALLLPFTITSLIAGLGGYVLLASYIIFGICLIFIGRSRDAGSVTTFGILTIVATAFYIVTIFFIDPLFDVVSILLPSMIFTPALMGFVSLAFQEVIYIAIYLFLVLGFTKLAKLT